LLHSNSYAVYPRTSNLEEVQKELATQQTSGITNEKEAARVGLGINPDSVLAVEAQSLGQNNIFIANIYGLRGGKLGALQEFAQQNYINLEDGMRAMILVARNISGQQVSNQDQEARQREIKAAANKAAFDAKKAAFAEKMEPFLRDSGIVFGGYGGLNLPGEVKDTQENAQISGFGGAEIGFFYNWFSINAGVQPNFGYHYSEMDTKTGATKMAVTYSFVQIPVTARADFFLNDITDKFGSFGIGFWAGPCINIAPWETKDNATVKIPSMGAIVGTEGTIGISNVIFCLGVQYALDLDSATVVFADKSSGEFTRKTWDTTFRVRIKVPFRKSSSFARGAVRVE
jgi:hypothetical protein